MKKNQDKYFLFSVFSIIVGFLIYYFFRENNILIYKWLNLMPKKNNAIIFSNESIWINLFRYNLPDGLWMLSGILLLRALWWEKVTIGTRYIHTFYIISILYELLQFFDFMPGTFDVLDLVVMASAAFVESVFYNNFRRRMYHEN